MKISYDQETDAMLITLHDGPIRESDEVRPGVLADVGEDGGIVRFEILDASSVVSDPRAVEIISPSPGGQGGQPPE